MSDVIENLSQLTKAVPTLELTVKSDEGKTVLMAGAEPIFRCRSNELGEAYGSLVMQGLKILPQALAALQAASERSPAHQIEVPDKADITARIVRSLTMSSDMRSRAEMIGKLVYSAIEPYLRGGDATAALTPMAQADKPASIDIPSVRRDAVQDFVGWLGEEGRLNKPLNEKDLVCLCNEWEASHA